MTQKLIGLWLVIVFLTACQTQPTTKDEIKEEDDFPEFTNEQLQEMIKNSPQAQMEMSKMKKNNYDLIQKIEELLVTDPDNLDHHYNVGKLYHQKYMGDQNKADIEKAIQHYTQVIDTKSNYQEGKCYYNRMLCYLELDKKEAALSDINQFEQINKGAATVNYRAMRAEIYFQLGQKDKACIDYQAALVIYQKDSLPIENETVWQERCR